MVVDGLIYIQTPYIRGCSKLALTNRAHPVMKDLNKKLDSKQKTIKAFNINAEGPIQKNKE